MRRISRHRKQERERELTCDDCRHSFVNPFDQRYCILGKTATRLCKDFESKGGEV